MKITMRLLVIAFTLFSIHGFSQSVSSDLASLNRSYYNLQSEINVKMIATNTTTGEVLEQTSYKSSMKGVDHYYTKLENSEILVTPKYQVIVNHEFQNVVFDSNMVDIKTQLPNQFFDTISKVYSSTEKVVISSKIYKYRLVPKFGQLATIDIFYNPENFLISKVVMVSDPEYTSPFKVEMIFSYSALKPTSIPSVSSFVTKTDSSWSLNKRLSKYLFTNRLVSKK